MRTSNLRKTLYNDKYDHDRDNFRTSRTPNYDYSKRLVSREESSNDIGMGNRGYDRRDSEFSNPRFCYPSYMTRNENRDNSSIVSSKSYENFEGKENLDTLNLKRGFGKSSNKFS